MKETKKPEEIVAARARAVRQAWIDRNRICSEARAILSQLEGWLQEHSKELDRKSLQCSRFPSDGAGRLVRQGTTACLADDVIGLAKQLIAGRNLVELVAGQQELLKSFYRGIRFNDGSPNLVGTEGDLILFMAWDAERAAVLILKAAITLQKQTVLARTRTSMEKFNRDTAEIRATTARDVLAVLVELKCAVESDQRLVEGLDPEEVACLKPQPFPLQILSSAAITWLLEAVSQKMIEPAELAGLQLETVKSAEASEETAPGPEASERWIQECQP